MEREVVRQDQASRVEQVPFCLVTVLNLVSDP